VPTFCFLFALGFEENIFMEEAEDEAFTFILVSRFTV
jgi:hypothetical protein